MTAKPYAPNRKTVEILNSAMVHIRSIPYRPGLRWVFYRLLQDDILTSKDDYKTLKNCAALARKRFYGDWRPSTLVDDGRDISESCGPVDRDEELERLHLYARLQADIFSDQPAVPFLIFEAATMDGQFKYFAPWADRCAYRGDPSIPHKWNIAQRCAELAETYELPVHVLYFGDLDKKGLQIPKSAMADIAEWCGDAVDLRFTRCGINPSHAERFNLSEKSLKPGTYEWESLAHDDAGTLIREALEQVVEVDAIEAKIDSARLRTAALQDEIKLKLAELKREVQ